MRPLVFLSHTHVDAEKVSQIRNWLNENVRGTVDFFQSSDDDPSALGRPWYQRIEESLSRTAIMLLCISPNSLERAWLYYEAGAAAARGVPAIPVCFGGVDISSLPAPLGQLNSVSLDSAVDRARLVRVVAQAAGIEQPDGDPRPLILPPGYSDAMSRFEWRRAGFHDLLSHADVMSLVTARLRDRQEEISEARFSGASLSGLLNQGRSSLLTRANMKVCEKIQILLKKPDREWSRMSHRGMRGFPTGFDASDSYEMCEASVRSARVLLNAAVDISCAVAVRLSDWPPTHARYILSYQQYHWCAIELISYNLTIVARPVIVFQSPRADVSPLVETFLLSFESEWADSEELPTAYAKLST